MRVAVSMHSERHRGALREVLSSANHSANHSEAHPLAVRATLAVLRLPQLHLPKLVEPAERVARRLVERTCGKGAAPWCALACWTALWLEGVARRLVERTLGLCVQCQHRGPSLSVGRARHFEEHGQVLV